MSADTLTQAHLDHHLHDRAAARCLLELDLVLLLGLACVQIIWMSERRAWINAPAWAHLHTRQF